MHIRTLWHRVYADFLRPSRLDAYGHLLDRAVAAGYEVHSVASFWALIGRAEVAPAGRYLVLRHDVDTDPATAGRLWQQEVERRLTSSTFVRLSTFDSGLVDAVAAQGGHVGYHFEELATVAKQRRIRDPRAAWQALPEARDLFCANLARLRARTGLPLNVVASHGDFVNRALGIQNMALLDDPAVRAQAGVELETNDAAFMAHVSSRHSDTDYPGDWVPDDPVAGIRRGSPELAMAARLPVVYLLTHPRHWHANVAVNLVDDLNRLREAALYRLPSLPARRV